MPLRCLVTAGNTRERIDAVRAWSNIFTGNTGRRIAEALASLGPTELLTSNAQHEAELASMAFAHPLTVTRFESHADLRDLLARRCEASPPDVVVMTAAVADYSPAGVFEVVQREALRDGSERWTVRNVDRPKVKSNAQRLAFLATPTEKLVDKFRRDWGFAGLLIKFKLEADISTDELLRIAADSRRASDADALIANTLAMTEGDDAGAFLVSDDDPQWIPRDALADRLRDWIARRLAR